MKRTPLTRKSALRSNSVLTRTPLKNGGALRAVGSRKKREIAETSEFRKEYLATIPDCEIGPLILEKRYTGYRNCTKRATCLHERKKRSQGGSLVDPVNLMASCTFCNGWVEDHPAMARSLGLVVHSYENPEDILVG